MSLTSLIQVREVAARLDLIIPKYQNRVYSLPYVSPRAERNRRSVIGTAFDYALRFELQRLNPHAIDKRWVAEAATLRLEAHYQHLLKNIDLYGLDRAEVIARYRGPRRWFTRIVSEAQAFHRRFIRRRHAREELLKMLATHALRLAALDYYYRARYLDPHPYKVIRAEVQEIVELLRFVPAANFRHPKVMMLNPTFGLLSALVGGADADLICGDRLIEIKTVAEGRVKRQDVRQLVGYFLLARRARQLGESLPEIRSIEIYFSRHGVFWSLPVDQIVNHPHFEETERWLMEGIRLPEALKLEIEHAPLRRARVVRRHGLPHRARVRPVDGTPGLKAIRS